MSDVIARILRERKREQILSTYGVRGRMIPKSVYMELKRVKKCEFCGVKRKKGVRLEIHHKKPVRLGGSNERVNLVAICRRCHEKAHEKRGAL